MPFVPAVCPNCGGTLNVEKTHDAAVCQFCGTPFIVEKAVNLYQNSTNLYANTVNITGESDFVIHAGELVKYNGSEIDVAIPDGVIKVGAAFQNMSCLRSVRFPKSIVEIGPSAFSGCTNLEDVYLTASISRIGAGAFAGCSKVHLHGMPDHCTFEHRYVCPVCGYVHEKALVEGFKCPICSTAGKAFLIL